MNFCQLSNYLGFFLVVDCFQWQLYAQGSVIALSLVLSIYYHNDETNELALLADVGGCVLLTAVLVYTLMRSDVILTPMNVMARVTGSAALTCYVLAGEDVSSEEYHLYHTSWYLFGFYGMAAFVYSYTQNTAPQPPPPLATSFQPKLVKVGSTIRRKIAQRKTSGIATPTKPELATKESSERGPMELTRLVRAIPRNPYEKARNFLVVVRKPGRNAICTGSTKDDALNEASKAPKSANPASRL